MKWRRGKRSADLEDRRAGGGGGFGGMPIPLPTGKASGGGLGLIAIVLLFLLIRGCGGGEGGGGGFDIPGLPTGTGQVPAQDTGTPIPEGSDPEAKQVAFVSFVLDDAQGFWAKQFAASGQQFQRAKLVLFRGAVASGCGQASSATGPFYCPLDQKAYVDLSFFDELNRRFQAPGDFAQAYVLAHEIGHHIQQQLGIEQQVRSQSESSPDDANELSVRLELQADCFAGLWARSAYDQGILESGDLEEGIVAAEAVGDDRIQEQAQGRIDPESFTHGTSEQRRTWFRRGFDSGQFSECDTFAVDAV
ncbi:MAG: KPN_02809 family neutral zinc metallopeptidase [Solirubrobacterales bacterium]